MAYAEQTHLPAELVSVLDAMAGPRILLDLEYRILAANQAYREEYGDPEGLIGSRCFEVSHRFESPCDKRGRKGEGKVEGFDVIP